jgi:hypothetical protein
MNARSIFEKGSSMGNIKRVKENHKSSGEERYVENKNLQKEVSNKHGEKEFQFWHHRSRKGNGWVEVRLERGEKEVNIPKFKGKAY